MLNEPEISNTHRIQRLLSLLHTRIASHDSPCSCELRQALERVRGTEVRLPAATVPACAFVPDAIAGLDQALRETLTLAADDLAWRVPGFGHLPPHLSDQMAVSVLVGPDGMVKDEHASLGLILLAPGVHYPSHKHAAEELYLVLSGALEWSLDGASLGSMQIGSFIHHMSWQSHSMINDATPALCFWGWTGDIRGISYSMTEF